MRIVIAGQTYKPSASGQGVFTIHLAEGLARAGHQVLVLFPSDCIRAYQTERNGVRLSAITALPLAPIDSEVKVTARPDDQVGRLLDEFAPDVVHIQDHYPLGHAVLQAALERRLPLIGTNHFLPENIMASMPLVPHSQHLKPVVDHVLWKMMLDVFNRLELAVSPTETGARILREHGLQVPIRVISCGVDTNRFFPDPALDRSATRLRFGLDPERTLLLYTGRLEPEKRLDILLWALRQLDREDVQLALVGRGRKAHFLKGLANRLELGNRVVFTGYIPAQDLNALLNSADIFIMPSDAELQSIATLEALATGRPILAANAGALPELVIEGSNGYLFPPGEVEGTADKIEELVDDREFWDSMGRASLEMVRAHHLSEMVRRYEEAYLTLEPSRLRSNRGG